eukprot:8240903-Pyramimonas_sp.AAC.1
MRVSVAVRRGAEAGGRTKGREILLGPPDLRRPARDTSDFKLGGPPRWTRGTSSLKASRRWWL